MKHPFLGSSGVLLALAIASVSACGGDDETGPKGSGGTGGTSSGGTAGEGGVCDPQSCADQGVDCGSVDDGCGRTLQCGAPCGTGGQGGDGSDGGTGGCTPTAAEMTTPRTARRARSSGFEGTIDEYTELYDVSCQTLDDCAEACLDRGGTDEMCGASECLPASAGSNCLPAPVWTNLESIQFEDTSTIDSIQLVMVSGSYHDALLADEFGLEVPATATIVGITIEIRKAGDEMVVDDSVRIIKGGEVGTAERASSARWPDELTWVSYGGADDLWGETWTPAEVNAADFGVALTTLYTQTVGNTRAYVDQVRATVHYQTACE